MSRGIAFQWLLGIMTIRKPCRRIYLLCLAEGVTYLVCTLSGFYALFLLHWLASANLLQPSAAIFLSLYGLVGVTGKLPDILNNIKLPGQ